MTSIISKYKSAVSQGKFLIHASLFASALLITSCTDWNDHYEGNSVEGSDVTLWEEILQHPELSDFAQVLEQTKVFRQHKRTATSYSELLKGGRSLTVFAPVNGTFPKDSLLRLVQTDNGDSLVERMFIHNHIAQKLISANGEEQPMRLFNSKRVNMNDEGVGGVKFKQNNIHNKNGVMHIMESQLPYVYTIYESLTKEKQYKTAGSILASYNEDIFDEDASVSSGIVDGKKVYVDSVMYERNRLLDGIGRLNAEDSTYYIAMPTEDGWNTAWKKATACYRFPKSMEKADSLQRYWTYRALLDNAVFSRTVQASMLDSMKCIHYNQSEPEYGVVYRPFDSDGLFGKANGMSACSNGYLYYYNEWPFDPVKTYFRKIETEAEYTWLMTAYSGCTYNTVEVIGSSPVSKGRFLEIKNTGGTTNWKVTYRVNNTLSGKYDVKVIIIPKTLVDPKGSTKPLKFKAQVNYIGENGESLSYTSPEFTNDATVVDTITVATIDFPACNFNQNNDKVSVSIQCSIKSTENTKYNRIAYLDAIVLEAAKEN